MTEQDLRFYNDLAEWWPLISPVEDYVEEAAYARTLLESATLPVTDVLELGSGGGHNAVHLKEHFTMTLVDIAEPMLEVSRRLNPECEHVCADMRTIRLDRTFDAVFVHDAIDYMISESDLRAAIMSAFVHCRTGGIAVFIPDETTETFEPGTDWGGTDGEGRGVRFLEWTTQPLSGQVGLATEYVFVLRNHDGSVETVHETHHTGLFTEQTWMRVLGEIGFDPSMVIEETTEDRPPRTVFIGRRPDS